MSNYTKTTDFEAKDSLPTGDSGKIIRGAEFETEFDAISTAIATKADTAGPTFTGTLTFETISDGTINVTAFVDEDDMSSDSATLVPTQQSVKAYVDAQVTAQDLDFQADSGGALSIDLDSETLTFTGGTGIDTSGSGNAVTFAIDSTVATLTGTQTLTNKTLTSPDVNTPDIDGGTIDGTVIGGTTAAAGSFTTVSATGNITVGGTVDGRDVATDGTKLDGIEALADVTDTTNVTAAGAVMDSELTNETAVKALDQGVATTDSPTFAGATVNGTVTADGLTVDGNTLYVDATNNRIGIGTTSTVRTLNLASSLPAIRLTDSTETGTPYGEIGANGGNITIAADGGNSSAGSSIIHYIDGSERMRIDSSGNVLIKTTTHTPTNTELVVASEYSASGTTDAGITLSARLGGSWYNSGIFANGTALTFTTGDAGLNGALASSEKMRIDSSGNVLFGRSTSTNPASDTAGNGGGMAWWENNNDGFLAVSRNNPSSDAIVAGFNRTNGDGKIVGFNKDGSQVGSIAAEGGDLVVGTGNVGMRFFDAFNAIIPRVSGGGGSDAAIDIGLVSGGNNFRFKDLYLSSGLRGDTTFKNNAGTTEYARFDSSGNLLVGKTSLAGTAGVIAYNTGALEAIRDGAASLFVNRLTSDGAIAEFRKDGTTVGSIGVNSSVIPYFVRSAGSVGGIALGGGATKKVYPCDTVGAGADDALDLGDSSTRFKDLYLSGGVVFGATSGSVTSKTLDDYEEGTFDFEFHDADSGGNTSPTTFTGYYTKIGRLVSVTVGPCNNINTSGMTSTGFLSFSLPFASSSNNRSVGSAVPSQVDFTTNRLGLNPFIANGVSRGQFQNYQNSGNRDGVRVSALTSGVSDFHSLTISYIT